MFFCGGFIGLFLANIVFVLVGLAGPFFLVGSMILGSAFLLLGVRLWRDRDQRQARRLFLGSIVYLPLLLLLLLADRGPAVGMAAKGPVIDRAVGVIVQDTTEVPVP